MNADTAQIIEVAKAGLSRFYDEGFYQWPEAKLRVVFGNRDLEDPLIQAALVAWQQQGIIRLVARPDLYIEMIKDFPA